MPTLTASTTLSLPAGQALLFRAGSGRGEATADRGGRTARFVIGPDDTRIGPWSTAVSVDVVIASGSVDYIVDQTGSDQTDQAPGLVNALMLTASGLAAGGQALTAGQAAKVRAGAVAIGSLYTLPASVTTALNNTEQLMAQLEIGEGILRHGSRLDILLNLSKIGGVSDTATVRIRVGKTGTASDSILVSVGLSTTLITWAYRTSVQIFSDGFRNMGISTAVVPTPGASATALASKTSVSDLLTGPVYVSIYCIMTSGAAEQAVLSALDIDARY